jgi:hypothetical protein
MITWLKYALRAIYLISMAIDGVSMAKKKITNLLRRKKR